jgi:hypothetical protein
METDWYQGRACLRHLRQKHPAWSYRRLTEETGYSYNWVRKWAKRLDETPPAILTMRDDPAPPARWRLSITCPAARR